MIKNHQTSCTLCAKKHEPTVSAAKINNRQIKKN